MHDVFISYSSKDYSQAETVRNILEKNNIPCWMAPRDIPYGSNYAKEIPSAIRNCQVFVLILSQNAQSSTWVLKELDSAVNGGKVIFPFMLEDCHLNDEFNFLLTGAQRYAAYQKKADAMETLISRIKAIIHPRRNDEPALEDPASAAVPVPPSPSILLTNLVCPACGSTDIRELAGKIGRFTPVEHLTILFPPLLAVAAAFVGLVLMALFSVILPLQGIDEILYIVGFLGGAVLGWYFGNRMVKEWIRRRRIRTHIHPYPYCCNACQKKFLTTEDSTR